MPSYSLRFPRGLPTPSNHFLRSASWTSRRHSKPSSRQYPKPYQQSPYITVWIGHCHDDANQFISYQPSVGFGSGSRRLRHCQHPTGMEVGNRPVPFVDHGNDGRHCVRISLGALIGIIVGIVALGTCWPRSYFRWDFDESPYPGGASYETQRNFILWCLLWRTIFPKHKLGIGVITALIIRTIRNGRAAAGGGGGGYSNGGPSLIDRVRAKLGSKKGDVEKGGIAGSR